MLRSDDMSFNMRVIKLLLQYQFPFKVQAVSRADDTLRFREMSLRIPATFAMQL
jgi:hypothetical protein